MTTALVLSGGGSRGDFEVGAVRYLYERIWPGGHPDIICGTSVGAINAAKLAEGAGGLDGLEAIWRGLRTNADMYVPEKWLRDLQSNDLPSTLKDFGGQSDFMKVIEVVTTLANPFALVWDIVDTIGDLWDLGNALSDGLASKSLYNLGPIQAKLLDPSRLDPKKVAASGIKLRLAMVALGSGALCWVDEKGLVTYRDGSPYQHPALAPQCQQLADQLANLDLQIREEQQALHDARTKGGAIPVIAQLLRQRVQVQQALTTCMAQHPPVLEQYRTSIVEGVLASASIPGVFPPVQTAGDWWVDGGVRAVLPVEAAIVAGADTIYAVAASRIAPDPATPLLGGPPLDLSQADFLDIIKHSADDIMPNEIMHADTDPPRGWGVPITVIRPMTDIHDGMTIDPGLIDIRMAEGYMRADDTIQAARIPMVDGYKPSPDDFSLARNTQLIVELRHHIWEREGGLDASGIYPPIVPPGTQPLPPLARLDELRDLKRRLRDDVQKRIASGGAVPPGHEQWWLTWERHQWTPNQPLWDAAHPLDPPGNLTVSVEPAKIPLGVPVELTVHATDQATGKPVDGRVLVDGTAIAVTNAPFIQVFTTITRFRIDPRTHAREPYDIDPVITVAAGGYTTAKAACGFTTGANGQPVPAPRISLRSVNYPTRYVRHQNFQGELTEIGSDLDKHDATFLVRPGLAHSALPLPTAPHAPAPAPTSNVPTPAPHAAAPAPAAVPRFAGGLHRFSRAVAAQRTFVAPLPPRTPIGGILNGDVTGVSFESVNYPGYFLCDQNGRLTLLQRPATPTSAFLQSATFRTELGVSGTGVSFVSLSASGHYLRHRDFHLYLEPATVNPATFHQDATFTIAPPWSPS